MTTPVQSPADEATDPNSRGALAVDITRTVPAPISRVWEQLISREGAATWLGEGACLGGKGEPYHCADGSSGVVRSYHPLEQLRVSWHETPDSAPSIVEIDLAANGESTVLELHHERISGTDPAVLRSRWSAGLDAFSARCAT
jgi:uncharacterized protein YndB with AHSA1/START domain